MPVSTVPGTPCPVRLREFYPLYGVPAIASIAGATRLWRALPIGRRCHLEKPRKGPYIQFFFAKKSFESFAITPTRAIRQIQFGIAIRALNISASVHTWLMVM